MIEHVKYPDALPKPSANYGGIYKTPTVGTQFTSGKYRRRKTGRTGVKSVTLEWLYTPDEFDLWESFVRGELNDGCLEFEIEMSTGGTSQTGLHVVQLTDDYSFTHEECNWRVTASCIIYPYPAKDVADLLEILLGASVSSFTSTLNKYYDRRYQQ